MPKLKTSLKIKTEWDLTHFYKSDKDPQIQKDILEIKNAYERFEKKYKGKTDWQKSEIALLKALRDYEAMLEIPEARPLMYYHFRRDLNSGDQIAEAQMNK